MGDNVEGVESVYCGSYYVESGISVADLIAKESGQIGRDMQAAFAAVHTAIESFDGTLEEAIGNEGAKIATLYDCLTDLQRVIQVDLSQHLGVTLTFNDNDGD